MYEALLRERMDAEREEAFDDLLARASGRDEEMTMEEKHRLLRQMGGEVEVV